MEFCHLHRTDGVSITSLSGLCPWGSFQEGEDERNAHSKNGEGVRTVGRQGPATGQLPVMPTNDFLQHFTPITPFLLLISWLGWVTLRVCNFPSLSNFVSFFVSV